jgi:hypothetical protein
MNRTVVDVETVGRDDGRDRCFRALRPVLVTAGLLGKEFGNVS